MAAVASIALITIANHATGETTPTSPASAAHPKIAPLAAAPKTMNRPRGSLCRRAIKAQPPMPMPAAITTRCMTSIRRLTAGVYAARVICQPRESRRGQSIFVINVGLCSRRVRRKP